MSDKSCDKSVPEVDCMPEVEHGPDVSVDHINLSAPAEVPESHRASCSERQKTTSSGKSSQSFLSLLPPRRLAFCGGGVRGVAHVGVLQMLDDNKLLRCVKEVIGISAGSLFALLYAVGYSLSDMKRLALEFDFTVLKTISFDSLLEFPLTFGLDRGESLEKLLSSILRHQGLSPTITFAELARVRPLRFRCYATELQGPRVKEFSLEKTPNTSLVFACRASMSLPFLYTPIKDPDSPALYMDGGLLNNLPFAFLSVQEIQETLGVMFTVQRKTESKSIETIFDLLKYMYDAAVLMKSHSFLEHYKHRIVQIPLEDFSSMNFSVDSEQRAEMISIAEKATRDFLLRAEKPRGGRRFSVA
jgi:predicted acylesterase/phospholipase RssA